MQSILRVIPLKIRFKWIESHQDDKNKKGPISDAAALNIQVDARAGSLSAKMTHHVPTFTIPSCNISISIGNVQYHHFPDTAIRNHVHKPALAAYIKDKTGWTDDAFNCIDWEGYEGALKVLAPTQQVNWIKLAHNWQHTGRQKQAYGHSENSWLCPFQCGDQDDPLHFCVCASDIRAGCNFRVVIVDPTCPLVINYVCYSISWSQNSELKSRSFSLMTRSTW